MVDLIAVFGIGFVGSLHCLGMCGPLILAYALNLEGPDSTKVGAHIRRNGHHHLAFHCGRLITYGCLGAGAALLFQAATLRGTLAHVGGGMTAIGGGLMIFLGAVLLKILPLPRGLSRFLSQSSTRWGARISPLLLSRKPASKMMLGLFAGFLPCGLSWAMILKAATTQDPLAGIAVTTAFGLGTVPVLFLGGFVASFLSFKLRVLGEKVAASSIIVMGLLMVSKGVRIFV
ncbi:MAG: sulfite exporter TauE/SafE family protein [Thermodesulfobacteriota bacterium]